MMSYGGIRIGMGDLASDAASAAAGAATGAIVTVPPGVKLARVVTSDPAPDGDLAIRVAPSDSAAQIPGGGAEKDGIVAVLNENASADGLYAEVIWPGGARRPGGQGFAHKKFLSFLPGGDPSAPGSPPGEDSGIGAGTIAAIGAGVLVAGGLAWWALK